MRALLLALVAALISSAAALASTLDSDGARLVWTAAAVEPNQLVLTDPEEGVLRITSTGDPVSDALPDGCTDASGAQPEGTVTDCEGFGEADFLAGDGDDSIDASAHGASGTQRLPLVLEGGPGDDTLRGGAGGDRIRGGDGYDTVAYAADVPVRIDQNAVADDGIAGEGDDVADDVERIEVTGSGDATVTTTAAANQVSTGAGDDTVDPGPGNDFVETGAGADTVNAQDGYADFIRCGDGADVANVDQFDNVHASCETVRLEEVPNARAVPDDAPPEVAWEAPEADRVEVPHRVSTLRVRAGDDRGVSQVVLRAGTRVLCTDTAEPYQCSFSPTDEDVGNATLVATAIDGAQQASTALRFVKVARFTPGLLSYVGPKRDRVRPHSFRAHGRVILPRNVARAAGCQGRVTIVYKAGRNTISTRSALVRRNCKWSKAIEFNRRLPTRKLQVKARFNGNDVLEARSGRTRKVRVR